MRGTALAIHQPALVEIVGTYTAAERAADCRTCRAYLKQWATSFKSTSGQPEISFDEFEAAAARLAL